MHITRKRLRRETAGAFLHEMEEELFDRDWYDDDPDYQAVIRAQSVSANSACAELSCQQAGLRVY